jgi:hypothetical protein
MNFDIEDIDQFTQAIKCKKISLGEVFDFLIIYIHYGIVPSDQIAFFHIQGGIP